MQNPQVNIRPPKKLALISLDVNDGEKYSSNQWTRFPYSGVVCLRKNFIGVADLSERYVMGTTTFQLCTAMLWYPYYREICMEANLYPKHGFI
jgi:hypothetical protein